MVRTRTLIKGFMVILGYYDTPHDNTLTELRIFIPVQQRIYAETIAQSHKKNLESRGMKIATFILQEAEVSIKEEEYDTPFSRTF